MSKELAALRKGLQQPDPDRLSNNHHGTQEGAQEEDAADGREADQAQNKTDEQQREHDIRGAANIDGFLG